MAIKSTVVQDAVDAAAGFNYARTLAWTQAGGNGVYTLNNGIANIAWSHAIPVFDADQVVLHCSDNWTGDTFSRSILIAWKYDQLTGTQQPQGSIDNFFNNGNWWYDTTSSGTSGLEFTDWSNTINRWTLGPPPPNGSPAINIQVPVQGFWMSIGVYSNGAVGVLSATQIFVERLRLSGANQGV